MHHARERLFSEKKKIWKTTYKKQALFLLEFSVDQFFLTTKHWKMWKTIFIKGFSSKQTEK